MVQGAKMCGASKIIGVDLNPDKEEVGKSIEKKDIVFHSVTEQSRAEHRTMHYIECQCQRQLLAACLLLKTGTKRSKIVHSTHHSLLF